MIEGWRICRAPYADLLGEGARLYGGRWNSPGRSLVYLAEHPALAAFEVRVYLDLPHDLLPDDYVLMRVELPDEPPEAVEALPADTVATGDAWITAAESAVLRVPSVLVPSAYNLLLNPRHPRAAGARVVTVEPFRFDPRLWAGGSSGETARRRRRTCSLPSPFSTRIARFHARVCAASKSPRGGHSISAGSASNRSRAASAGVPAHRTAAAASPRSPRP